MTEDELKRRTKQFSLRVLRLCAALPNTPIGRMICGQLGRSGTSVGANYRAVCKARSRAEFIAKIGVVAEEADESAFWLELIMEERLLPARKVQPLHQEAIELDKIMTASKLTAKRSPAIENRKSKIENC